MFPRCEIHALYDIDNDNDFMIKTHVIPPNFIILVCFIRFCSQNTCTSLSL